MQKLKCSDCQGIGFLHIIIMKTAMQELIEELNGSSFQELFSNQNYIKEYLESRIKLAYIEREKRQLKSAFISGSWDTSGIEDENELSNNYYQETFGDKDE